MLQNIGRVVLLALVLITLGGGVSSAADFPDEQLEVFAKRAHSFLPNAKLSDGSLIGEERAKTLTYPLIPTDMIKFIVVRGHMAGFAAHCGLDWENGFYIPLMSSLRAKYTEYTDYQWAYVGVLHGMSMGNAEQTQAGKPCTDDLKDKLSKNALKK